MKKSKLKWILSIVFFLIFVELAILYLREEFSLIKMLEVTSVALVVLLYYFIVRSEVKLALKSVEEGLMRVEKKFEGVEKRFEKVEKRLEEDINVLKKKINELSKLLGSRSEQEVNSTGTG
jgi:uncharacterized protein YoxC